MGRYDKYDPKVGGFRAPLAADFDPDNLEKVLGVGLDTNGRVVVGAGQTGVLGLLVLTKARKAGEVIDVMTSGEITEFGPSDENSVPGTDFGDPGTVYYSDASGVVTDTNAEGSLRVGHTVEGQRLIVRCEQTTTPASVGSVAWGDVTGKPAVIAAGADRAAVLAILGTGTPSASNYLKGDGSWGTVT